MRINTTVKYIPVRKGFPKVYRYQKGENDYFLVDGRSKRWGLKIRRNFNSKDAALKYAQEIEAQILENGKSASNNLLYQDKEIERLDAKLKPFGKTLSQAVDFYIESLQSDMKKSVIPPIKDLCLTWYDEKTSRKSDPKRNRTKIEYKSYLNYITRTLGSLKPAEVQKRHIRDLLDSIKGEQLTRKKYLQYFKNFFNWCVDNNYTTVNPTKGVKIKIPRRDIAIYSPEDVGKLLKLCEEKYPSLLGYYCLCVFGGLRPSEAERVKWDDLNFDGAEVLVTDKSKTGLRRFVLKDTQTLWVWLKYIKAKWPNEPLNPTKNHVGLQRKVRKEVGLIWAQDILRHSFGTYYYNLTRDLNQVSHDMGNTVGVCKKYYVREVMKTWNEQFWSLHPNVSEPCQKENSEKTEENALSPLESMVLPSGIEPESTV